MRGRTSLSILAIFAMLVVGALCGPAAAQLAPAREAPIAAPLPEPALGAAIDWRVRNRFRLFRDERDFDRLAAAQRGRSVLAAEQALALETGGRGWARDIVTRLCVDSAGNVVDECVRERDVRIALGAELAPIDHPVEVRLAGSIDPSASCAWTFEDGDGAPRSATVGCDEPINIRVVHGRPTIAVVDISAN